MTAYCFCGLSLDTIQKIGSLLFGLITLIIVIAGYFKFLQNKLRDKQLDTVYELIKQSQQSDWQYLYFNNFDNLPLKHRIATLFDITEIQEFEECDNLFFWGVDIEPLGENLLSWDFFFKFYSHPLLPISIARPLKKLNLWRQQSHIQYKDAKDKKYIAIGRKKIIPEDAYYFYFSEGEMMSCKGFKQAATELRDSIVQWATKYGLDDLNITTSHIYRTEK
ncbi:MAG: hypothetical protein NTV01_20220 [Bacteroidia bacterium]|nr:hypothetical protein [Bacteroidia bacterium]